ncbi:hypothetical protein [Tropicimonas isoalkanivorans]|uniref:Uncharacterized protein n=1 Tax=Tropicimonas isoalkanivorans TaxID=441112 RepID=A0A1I1DDS7_9RHOB|nr:hypothetical protein [Tropicimonas isoalkanivorans]SFB72536.1 hypothetical protein SAMN04488094_101136 [Tropicimonas isoalkanivorans]
MYYNQDEIITAVHNLARRHSDLARPIRLPHLSPRGRFGYALLISTPCAADAPTMIVSGGWRAGDWLASDGIVSVAADLLGAVSDGHGLHYGSYRCPRRTVRDTLDALRLVLVPCIHPDIHDLDPVARHAATETVPGSRTMLSPGAQNLFWLRARYPATRWRVNVIGRGLNHVHTKADAGDIEVACDAPQTGAGRDHGIRTVSAAILAKIEDASRTATLTKVVQTP